ncbi:YciI family protein [Marinitoga aeolica]|uniref:YCII-related domain-containing protein n=1 Tax=Marinitoga aeolica TaxID=2809031 RepID=A0ABY8PPL2_9BACT|nr:YciI family protein [Marinitoga aeolica]WGS64582.1 hypothetical protein JRV97_09425 [Marinitoga aeolica]
MRQFIYILKLIPKYMDENNWTEETNEIISRHFFRLKEYTEKGKIILVGRVPDESDPESFGIVIFEEENEEKANEFMQNDPAVKEGIMTAKLFPFKVALIR